jgi:acetolactate synthase-1/2/3 large subunit
MKLSDYVFQRVAETGVKHVFVIPGGMAMHLNDSLGQNADLEYICSLHEQAATIGAEAYSKATGNFGVALVTAGPGSTNAITGVAGAWMDSTPMMVISGQVKRSDLMRDRGLRSSGIQEVDICRLVGPITKYAATVEDPEAIRYHFDKAVHLAQSGRPGPVWLDIPLDVQAAEILPQRLEGFSPPLHEHSLPERLDEDIMALIDMFNAAERPLLLIGNGVRLARSEEKIRQVIDLMDVPYAATWLSFDMFDHADARLVGRPGAASSRGANFAVQNSDFLLMIGARMDNPMTAFAPRNLARAAKRVSVDIDPAELAKLDGVLHKSFCLDAGVFLDEIIRRRRLIRSRNRSQWREQCARWTQQYPLVLPRHRQDGPVSIFRFAEVLGELSSPRDLIIPASSGIAIEILLMSYVPQQGQRVFITTALGAMGYGLPAAIGACLASGRRRTICLEGDGGIQLNIQELETLSRLKLPVKLFVANNGGYSAIRTSQQRFFGRVTAATPESGLTLPNILKVADAYGLKTASIERQDRRFADRITQILEDDGPTVCELSCDPDELPEPRVSSRQTASGSMVSMPLEDLSPFLEREEFLRNMLIPTIPME